MTGGPCVWVSIRTGGRIHFNTTLTTDINYAFLRHALHTQVPSLVARDCQQSRDDTRSDVPSTRETTVTIIFCM